MRDHASEREKLAISADYYFGVSGELEKAAQTYQQEIENYPREFEAYGNLGTVYGAKGQHEKAAEITRQALRLAPGVVPLYGNLAYELLALQRFDETRQVIHGAEAQKLDDDSLHISLYVLAFLAADSRAMAEQQQWFADKPDYENDGLTLASDAEAYVGDVRKARELNKRAVDLAVRADNKEIAAVRQAITAQWEAAYYNVTEARRTAAEALKLAPTSQAVESEAALAFAMAGDIAGAKSLAEDLGETLPAKHAVAFALAACDSGAICVG